MRYEVGGITVGDEELCALYGGSWTGFLVHAAKDRCHRAACGGYDKITASHPEYLSARRGNDLFLNAIDPPLPLFRREMFTAALDFIDEGLKQGQPVGCHCNKGQSRAPSVVLLYLAKRAGRISDLSYAAARTDFEKLVDPGVYEPGEGIRAFLSSNWTAIA